MRCVHRNGVRFELGEFPCDTSSAEQARVHQRHFIQWAWIPRPPGTRSQKVQVQRSAESNHLRWPLFLCRISERVEIE